MTQYYIDENTGKDSHDGLSIAKAWKTFQKGAQDVIFGDVVNVRNGIYNERVMLRNGGVEFVAFPGHKPIIEGAGISVPNWNDGLVEMRELEEIKFIGIEVTGSKQVGILVDNNCKTIEIKDCYTHDHEREGIRAWESENIIIDGNEIENVVTKTGQECITLQRLKGFKISNNHIHHITPTGLGGEGIDAKNGCEDGKIFKNKVHDSTRLGIYIDGGSQGCSNIDIYENELFNIVGGPAGIAVASERGGILKNIRIFDNICYENGGTGISIGAWPNEYESPADGIEIFDNTVYNCGYEAEFIFGSGILHQNDQAVNVVIRDNIVIDCSYGQIVLWRDPNRIPSALVERNLTFPFRGGMGEVACDDFVIQLMDLKK